MTQTASRQKIKTVKQTKQTSVANPEIDNEVSTDITKIPGFKKKKSTSANPDTPTEPIEKKRNKQKKSKSKLNPPIPKELGMEVICEQAKFYDALFLVNCATPAKPSHPILANVLIIADVETQQIGVKPG
ncbi:MULTISPECIES: hypothetical protein [unclassified Dolichospermum]|uniref:hypothetical protein n=1 Tax=unclassified Dolichospermum TaxID=2622029 RepID=UPI0020C3FCF8|nr:MULTISPECIES: hypothetical protein [unclassified Dolichospermum]